MNDMDIIRDVSVVCKCRGVKYRTIRIAIENGADTLEAIRQKTGANSGCGQKCTAKIEEMIQKHRPQ